MVERIEGYRPVHSVPDFGPAENIKPIKRQTDPLLTKDTIESLSKANWNLESPISLFGNDNSPKGINLDKRPKLETPDQFDARKVEEEMDNVNNHLIHRTEENQETGLDKQWVEVMRLHRENLEEGTQLKMKSLKDKMEENKTLRKTYFERMDEVIENQKTSKVLGWVDTGLTVALVAGGIAGILFAVFTGGASLALTAATAAAGVADGGVKIANGVVNHQTNLKSGELLKMSEQRKMNQDKVKDSMDQMKQSQQKVMETWQLLGKIERTKQDTALDITNNMRG